MNQKLRWITQTAVLLALLITLQALTKPAGQLVTGSCVNCVLAMAALIGGVYSGITVGVISPVLAYLLGIAPQPLTVPAIMVANAAYVALLYFFAGRGRKGILPALLGWLSAAVAKFISLYGMVGWLLCRVLAEPLLSSGLMKEPMLKALPATFSWPQLITALVGGAVALLVAPAVGKALNKGEKL